VVFGDTVPPPRECHVFLNGSEEGKIIIYVIS
jgi:hypothetical protein